MPFAAVGSTNPVKVGAAERIFARLLPDVRVISVAVPSGVSEQPIGDEETIKGAVQRAEAALAAAGADWGIGMEGGVTFRGEEAWLNGYCAVLHRDGRVGIGRGPQFLLPPLVARALAGGSELGPLMDKLSGVSESKKKGGAIGFLTQGAVQREEVFTIMVATALVRFLHPELYQI